MSNSLLETAEAYLDRGLSVIPMIDKKPAVRWKRYQANRPTRRHLNRWFDGNREPTGTGDHLWRRIWEPGAARLRLDRILPALVATSIPIWQRRCRPSEPAAGCTCISALTP